MIKKFYSPNPEAFTMIDNRSMYQIMSQAEPKEILDLLAVYNLLSMFRNTETNEAFPSLDTLCGCANTSKRKMLRCINRLEEIGVIEVIRGGKAKSNTYKFLNQKKHYKPSKPKDEDDLF